MPVLYSALIALACSDAGGVGFTVEAPAVQRFGVTDPRSVARLRKGMTQRELTDLLGRPHCWNTDLQNNLYWADGPDKCLWVYTDNGRVAVWEVRRLPYSRLTAAELAREIRHCAKKEWKPRE